MNIAILIDAENVDPLCAGQIFSYAGSIGTVTVKEIYGAGIALNEWSEPIFQYAIHMNMTLKPNRYKNSSDIALVIGAMDLLHARTAAESAGGAVDTIIIASSDSDFSALAVRLRAAGIEVVGMGNREKTNPAWPMACSTFIPLGPAEKPMEALAEPNAQERTQPQRQKQQQPAHKTETAAPTHAARMEHIRAFLTEQLAANGGRIQSAPLLALLKELPDYRLDQQGSKRKPLDYLARQYGEILKVEKNPDGTVWICAPSAAPAEEPKDDPDLLRRRLAAAGIPDETARKIAGICKESKNMRSTYNKLRKTFGGAEGGRYYRLVKQQAAE